jgi:hypothetical protein
MSREKEQMYMEKLEVMNRHITDLLNGHLEVEVEDSDSEQEDKHTLYTSHRKTHSR